ncbi:MAG: deoxyhypusine synthase [Candidatus Nanohaloarchaeota archaeon QJJ-9]|nr:deoxyhypusine synthase [Candidatus Nanohaloarchaeota archaeon QJJ-9]
MTEDPPEDIYKQSEQVNKREDIEGYSFRGELDFNKMLEKYKTTGFQASELYEAIELIKEMQKEEAKIYLTFTSNIISSGLREAVAFLAREELVDVMITTSGSVTEDIIKTKKPFKKGEWEVDEAEMRERGVNRLGNIFVPSDRYIWLEDFLREDFFPEFFEEEKIRTPTEFSEEVGEMLEDEDSFLKHASKNDIPIFCPALIDAEVGNFLYYYRKEEDKDVGIEILEDYDRLIQEGLDAEKTGLIVVGGGVPKHQAIMTNLFRGGADYAVYISTGMEGDGSLSGAPPEEAVSWGKIKEKSKNYAEVEAEATLVLPLIIAGAFKD